MTLSLGPGTSMAMASTTSSVGAAEVDTGENFIAGESYVVFGRASGFGPSLDVASLDGTNGFRLEGADDFHRSGWSVASAGDVDGDGFADIIASVLSARMVVPARATSCSAATLPAR